MISGDQLQQLKSENELLRIQLKDINEMIAVREEELTLLRRKDDEADSLRSKLENSLLEMDTLQQELGLQQQKAYGSSNREAALETEILEGIRMEKEYYDIRDRLGSARAEITQLQQETMETKKLNQVIAQLKTRVAELESQLDLVEMDQGFLREELAELRAWKEASAPEQKHRS